MKTFSLLTLLLLFVMPIMSYAAEPTPTMPEDAQIKEQSKDDSFGNYLPADIPNIFDPEVRLFFQPKTSLKANRNENLPVLLMENEFSGQSLLLFLDARNGKDTWGLSTDPIVLIILKEKESIKAYVDVGFRNNGKANRIFEEFTKKDVPKLFDYFPGHQNEKITM